MAWGVTQSYIRAMFLTADALKRGLRPGGRHGLASTESRDPIGLAVAGLNRLARSEMLDRLGMRKQAEQAVFTVTRGGFRTATAAGRQFARLGTRGAPGARPEATRADGLFDLTPTEDEQLLVAVAGSSPRTSCGPRPPRPTRPVRPPTRCSGPAWRSGCRSSVSPRRWAASPRSARRWPAPWSPRRSPTVTWAWPWRRSPRARWPPPSACGAPTPSSAPTCPPSPATTYPPPRWR